MIKPLLRTLCAAALVTGAAAGSSASIATAQEAAAIEMIELDKLTHTPIPAFPGVASIFIVGAFDRAGLYAAQGEMKQGAVFPPHSHPDMRLSIVTSGTMYLGFGETFDPAKLVAYPVGTMAITPANTPHFMSSLDGDVTVLEIGAGPSGASFFEQ